MLYLDVIEFFISNLNSFTTEDTWLSFFRPRDCDIIILDALVHVPGNEEKQQTLRISLSDPPACSACTDCRIVESEDNPEKK